MVSFRVFLSVVIFSFAVPVIAKDRVYLFNEQNIKNMQSHNITFRGSDGCRYYGNSKSINTAGAIKLTKRSCNGVMQKINRKAYIIELRHVDSVTPMVPDGSTWTFRKQIKQ
ncbi:hypothetical protein [Klebsiella aerogenes]|uniref:Uncharacterized protein n=1 Tax=Klebsiella aerogenes TaxID=548 RepID=A0AAP9U9B0_KLEAE|nr:hypothetical protein [Klebsiella aerogenes]QMR43132.1 hypothetical protein HV331_27055 [Klebsiella aerogenes]